jgi:hypothetical protein
MTDALPSSELVEISHILIGPRSRKISDERVIALANTLQNEPLYSPILLRQTKQGPMLVAGCHRLAAFKKNRMDRIPAIWSDVTNDTDAKQQEVLENLNRENLCAFDLAHHLYDWKCAYEDKHPETKHGAQGGRGGQTNEGPQRGFSKEAAYLTGMSTSKIKEHVAIWAHLCTEAKIELEGSKFIDRKADIKALSKQSETVQKRILKLLFPLDKSMKSANSVLDALEILNVGRPLDHVTKKIQNFHKTMRNMSDEEFDMVMTVQETRVLDWARKRLAEE